MKPKDLKNSEELKVTESNDSVLDENLHSDADATDAYLAENEETMAATTGEVTEEPAGDAFTRISGPQDLGTEPDVTVAGLEISGETAEAEKDEEHLVAEPVEEAPVSEETPVSEEVPATEPEAEAPAAAEEAVTGPVEEVPVAEETPVSEEVPATEPEAEAPAAAEEAVTGPVEEVPVSEEAPVSEEVPATEPEAEAPAAAEEAVTGPVEEVPVSEEAPVSEEVPVTEPEAEAPAAAEEAVTGPVEEASVSEEAPVSEEVPATEPEAEAPAAAEELSEELESGDEDVDTEEEDAVETTVDYSSLSRIELVNLLREVVEENPDEQGHNADAIIAVFYRKSRELKDEAKKKFIEEGGNEEDFEAEEDPYGNDVKELLKKYRQIKFEQGKKLDAEKEINLQKKYEIIEEIKGLLNKEESINRTFQEFRDLQKKWYEIGQVPQAKMKDLWDTYHFHVENFYDYIKINKELRDLDLRKNLEAKIELCEKAEELLVEPSVIKAFNLLQKYHEEWREIGPVPADKKEDIWERFKAATSKINQKHQDYFEKRKLDQKKNLDAKVALCEKAEEISAPVYNSHREWDEKSRELIELQKVWKTIGFAPKRENNKVYDRFRVACDRFFTNKREYYSKNKDLQQENLQMKVDLCLEAETLKESTDWKKTTQQFIDIQKRWKEIGPIPRKSSDAIWKRFRAACDYFFERKSMHFSDIDGEQLENLKEKEKLIGEVENFKPDDDPAESLKILREFQRRWTEIGHVPIRSKDTVQRRFREAINKQFDSLNIDNSNRNVFNFRSKIESMTDNARGLSKVRSEREKYMMKLKQLETDLTLLDNNIGFFANSKNAQVLIADVNQKIRDTREKIEQLKEKIRIIDDLDKSEY